MWWHQKQLNWYWIEIQTFWFPFYRWILVTRLNQLFKFILKIVCIKQIKLNHQNCYLRFMWFVSKYCLYHSFNICTNSWFYFNCQEMQRKRNNWDVYTYNCQFALLLMVLSHLEHWLFLRNVALCYWNLRKMYRNSFSLQLLKR